MIAPQELLELQRIFVWTVEKGKYGMELNVLLNAQQDNISILLPTNVSALQH